MPDRKAKAARIEYLRAKNDRALRDVDIKSLTPLTALLGSYDAFLEAVQ
jgi:hypothetical protein